MRVVCLPGDGIGPEVMTAATRVLRALLPELVRCGMIFVTSAVESLSERVLGELRKGHSAADVPVALRAVRDRLPPLGSARS